MGVVYAALDPELDRRVAVKVLRVVDDDARARLLREARAMAKLTHPNVVTVFEVGSADDQAFIAMELVDGSSLADWLEVGSHSLAERLAAMLAAGRGLAAAHAAGIVHRDFKPHNVLRALDGRILVTDFGLARSAAGAAEEPVRGAPTSAAPLVDLTRTGVFLGTPAYMAPEQWSGGAITAATDQFAFCVSLWEAITRKRPFTGTTLDELRAQIERGPALLDTSGIPRSMQRILRRGLDRDPAQRWPSMTALLDAITRSRRGRRWVPILVVNAIVAVALGGFIATHDWHSDGGRNPAPLTMQFTKLADGHVTAPQAAIDGLVEALRTKTGAKFVQVSGKTEGFKVFAIRVGSYLDAIGLLNGDTLTAIDGQPIDTAEHLEQVLRGLPSKPELRLDVLRAGAAFTIVIDATVRKPR